MNEGARFAVYSAIFIGINVVFANAAAKRADPLLVSAYSLIISSALLFIMMLVKRISLSAAYKLKAYPDFWKIVVSRNIIGVILLVYGFSMTTAINSLVILRLEPVLVIIFGYLLMKERITPGKMAYVAATVAGAILVSTGGNLSLGKTQAGDLLVLSSLVVLGYSYIPSKRMMKKADPVALTAASNIAGGLFLLLIAIIFSVPIAVSAGALMLIFGSVITYYVIGLVLWFEALKRISAWKVSALLSVGPIAGGALAFLWLGESMNAVQLIGAVIVLAASYKISIGRK